MRKLTRKPVSSLKGKPVSSLQNITLSETLEPYQAHKLQAQELDLPGHYPDNPDKAQRCAHCGDDLTFDKYRHLETSDILRVLAWANFCKVRWCPMCAWRKASKLILEILSILSQIERDHKVAYVFLTLTTRNAPLSELRALSAHMSKSWQRLIQTKSFRKSVLGYIRALEFMGDKTPDGQAHPHFHSVLVVPPSYFSKGYIPQAQWCEMWQKALRADYKPIVDIRGIRVKSTATTLNTINPALYSALRECVKYIAKSAKLTKLDQEQFKILDQQAKGIRQFNLGGLVKSIKPLELEPLDPSFWEQLEQEFYKWSGQAYKPYTPSGEPKIFEFTTSPYGD
ncbi:protein rep [Helicobacter baculiformis]|uniref:Protein rep n=1 Tax=Helicobacter baculiformis TaxID=427351 RepID=A0ABV7ZLC5_9HELI|nr:protein rep [Helicobacter baculiformis]